MQLCQTLVIISLFCNSISKRRIINGRDTLIEEFPFMVSLWMEDERGVACGGSIIAPTWILTATHCPYVQILAGHDNPADKPWNFPADTYRVINRYELSNPPNDNARRDTSLLLLDRPITYTARVQPVKLPAQGFELADNEDVISIGWGETEGGPGSMPATLQSVTLKYINTRACQEIFNFLPEITDTVLCTGHNVEFIGHCFGDSGGPTILADGTQVGVMSFAAGFGSHGKCASPGTAGGNMKVAKFVNQIETVTKMRRGSDGYLVAGPRAMKRKPKKQSKKRKPKSKSAKKKKTH